MTVGRARIFLSAGSVLLGITAGMHAVGWFSLRDQFSADVQPVVRLLWFGVDLDWLVVSAIWALAAIAGTGAYRLPVLVASIIPLGSAIWLAIVVGPAFIGVYMLAFAALLAVIGGRSLGRITP